jgi:aminopeptidase N
MRLVGPENFRRGVAGYLRRHEYGNTSTNDFLRAISEAADLDLDQWGDDWLLEPGTNTVEVEFSCADNRIRAMTLIQGVPDKWPTLRTHRTQLGLYDLSAAEAAVQTIPVTYSGERTEVDAAVGLACPDLIYANHGDWDFARVLLAPETVALLDGRLQTIADPMTRLMLWQSIWVMALDARLPVSDYANFALENLPAETGEAARRQVLSAIASSLSYLREMPGSENVLATLQASVESFLWTNVESSAGGSDEQLLYFDSYISAAATAAGLDRLVSLLTDPATVPEGIQVDQDRRWNLLQALARVGHPGFAALFADETLQDRSDEGLRRVQTIAASLPDAALKQERLNALLDPTAIDTLAEFRAVAGGLFPSRQHELQLEFSEQALAGLGSVNSTRDAAFFASYVGGLLGPLCSEDYLGRLDRALAEQKTLHPIIIRSLMDSRFEVARCLRMSEVQASAN